MRRVALFAATAALAVLPMLWAHSARAHEGNKLRGTCTVENNAGRASVTLKVDNLSSASVMNLTPSPLSATTSGTATLFVQTGPRALREVLPGKSGSFLWKGRFYGDGYLDLTVEVGGEFGGDHSETTGLVNCNRVSVGNPDGQPPTVTPRDTAVVPTRTSPPDTPVASPSASRPTRTPVVQRPTRTPRLDPTREPTATRTITPTSQPKPTRTPAAARPTRTPVVQATRQPTQPKPTRTPVVQQSRPTSTSRPTRTPIVQQPTATRQAPTQPRATSTSTRPLPTRTSPPATRTAVPPRATRTPQRPATARPTRTSFIEVPTPTQRPPVTGGGLVASCSLRRTEDFVVVTMIVDNRSGMMLSGISVSPLQLDPEGGALIFDRAGPAPSSVNTLREGESTAFQWTGRLTPGGTMGFSAFATASSPIGPLQTTLTDCGVTGVDPGSFDPASFNGSCSISPGENGEISVDIRNGSRETLTDVEVSLVDRVSTGNAGAYDVRGPAPRMVASLASGSRRSFTFGARFLGDGDITMSFRARGTRVTHLRVETQVFECTVHIGSQAGGNLPDLAIDEAELKRSIMFETRNFAPDDCAIFEGCVDGSGMRRLLRFSTVTPNYGPGDVFLGDPLDNPLFVYSECHNHFHFEQYASYRLRDMSGNVVARGHKQAFCLVDLWQVPGLGGDPRPQFPTCEFQGISAGWADIYHRGLDCQWVDVTNVPPGRYILEVEVNPSRGAGPIVEHDYSNNTGRAEVIVE